MIAAIPGSHILGDLLDILILSVDWDSRDTRQIYHGKIWARMRINIEHDRLINNVLFLATNFISKEVYGFLDLLEVGELLIGDLFEFSPWLNQFRCVI